MDNNLPNGGAGAGDGGADPKTNQDKANLPKDPPKDPPGGAGTGDEDKKVSWADHKRALDDLHKYKADAKSKGDKIVEMENSSLAEKQEYKTLYERTKEENTRLADDLKSSESLYHNTQKHDEVKNASLELGIRPEALVDLDLLKLDGVTIEKTDQGRYMIHGAKEFATELKKTKPHWFKSEKAPNINSGGGGAPPGDNGPITPKQMWEAEKQMKIGRITKLQYEQISQKYLSQAKT